MSSLEVARILTIVMICTLPLSTHLLAQEPFNPDDLIDYVDESLIEEQISDLLVCGSRISGSEGYNQSLDWINHTLSDMGYLTESNSVWIPSLETYSSNLIAWKLGIEDELVILSAHLDSVSNRDANQSAPGANDNGSGVVCLLELARIIQNISLERTVGFFFFTGEEQDFDGSRAWITNNPEKLDSIDMVLNFDMIGVGKILEVNWISDRPYETFFVDNLETEMAILTSPIIYQSVSRFSSWVSSDQVTFWDAGIPALLIKSHEAPSDPNYHTSNDLPIFLNFTLIGNAIRLAIVALETETFTPITSLAILEQMRIFVIISWVVWGTTGGAFLANYLKKKKSG